MTTLESSVADHPGLLRLAGTTLIAMALAAVLGFVAWRDFDLLSLVVSCAAAALLRTGLGLCLLRARSLHSGVVLFRLMVLIAMTALLRQVVQPTVAPWSLAHVALLVIAVTMFWLGWFLLQSLQQLARDRQPRPID